MTSVWVYTWHCCTELCSTMTLVLAVTPICTHVCSLQVGVGVILVSVTTISFAACSSTYPLSEFLPVSVLLFLCWECRFKIEKHKLIWQGWHCARFCKVTWKTSQFCWKSLQNKKAAGHRKIFQKKIWWDKKKYWFCSWRKKIRFMILK